MPDIRYVPLTSLFPKTHRVTLYRWRRDGKIPPPDLRIGNREFWIERPLAPPAEAERRPLAQQPHPETT